MEFFGLGGIFYHIKTILGTKKTKKKSYVPFPPPPFTIIKYNTKLALYKIDPKVP